MTAGKFVGFEDLELVPVPPVPVLEVVFEPSINSPGPISGRSKKTT